MSKSAYWTNDDGLVVGFGARASEDQRGGKVSTYGNVEEHVVEFAYDDLPDGVLGSDGSFLQIPAHAIPIGCFIETIEAFVGGTSYDIDLVDSAGAAIGSGEDKLFDAIAIANMNVVGEKISAEAHAGTNSGNALGVELASAGTVKVAATGTYTAGRARITIQYVK